MIYDGSDQITALMVGEIGIKTIVVGEETIYTRSGGYFYLELDTKEN